MRQRVRTFDVAVGGVSFPIDAYDWRSAMNAARKRFEDLTGRPAPFVPKSDVIKRKVGR